MFKPGTLVAVGTKQRVFTVAEVLPSGKVKLQPRGSIVPAAACRALTVAEIRHHRLREAQREHRLWQRVGRIVRDLERAAGDLGLRHWE